MGLLETRRLLLISRGYDAETAGPGAAHQKLVAGGFDLLVLSAMVGEEDRTHILTVVPQGTRTLVLKTLVKPDDLLEMVERALA